MRTLALPGMDPPMRVRPAARLDAERHLARAVPRAVRLGTSSWSFPGWAGLVYDAAHPRGVLAREGLSAYAAHPLLRAAGVDRTYYAALSPDVVRAYREAVPDDFRFVFKAHAHCTWERFPAQRRFGALAGQSNPRFLDPHHALDAVVGPLVDAVDDRLGAVVFQFPPQSTGRMGDPQRFADCLQRMLESLPPGPCYAVEIRSRHLFGPAYERALRNAHAVHCVSVHPAMPDLDGQLALATRLAPRPLVVRWNLGHGRTYEVARQRYTPFHRLVDPDPVTRRALAGACVAATRAGAESTVVVNNKAEGCAPASIRALAAEIAARARGAR